ncbi:MAG: cytochrome c biogenesis protein ResB, partial [Deltaproteobacteria bacterium]|nr:cytochrome c biogenesis protein ResB [Deltaproteobacteria bacterium]
MTIPKGTIDQITDFLASVKLALVLLIALAAVAVLGTIVPQNLDPEQYLHAYGPRLYTFLSYLDMFDMYRSWWFTALLAFLVVNLVICSINRLPGTLRLAKSVNPTRVSVDFLQKQALVSLETLSKPAPDLLPDLRKTLSRGFSNPKETTTTWGILLHTEKGAFSRFGAYMVHLSILVIIAGAIIGNRWGFSAYLNLPEGQTAAQVEGERPPGRIP